MTQPNCRASKRYKMKFCTIVAMIHSLIATYSIRPSFFYFFVLLIFSQQVRVGGRNKNKNKIHSDHFPIELKSKETRKLCFLDFNSIGKWAE